MKILFVTRSFPTIGTNMHTYNLVKVLSKSHEVSLVCFETNTPYKKEKKYYKQIEIVPFKEKNFLTKAFKSLLFNTPFCVLTNQSEDMAKTIKNMCREVKFDIVIFEQLVMGQYYFCVQNCPKLLFPVDATSRIKEQRFYEANDKKTKFMHYIDYLIVKKYENFIYDKFDGIIFVSNFDTEYTLKNIKVSPQKVHTLPLGVDISYYYPANNFLSKNPSIVFVGNMFWYPNHHGILWFYNEVWKKLKEKYPELLFYIVGNSPDQDIKNLSVHDKNIIVTGYVEDVRPYIWQASIFVSPLQIGTGMKNKVLQAMAMGKAVVASPLDIQGTQVEDKKHVIVAKNSEEFVKYIVFLLQNKEEREKIGYNARKFIEKWHTIEEKGNRFIDIVSTVIKNH